MGLSIFRENALLVDAGGDDAIGDVGSSPSANTVLGRLKALADALALLYTGPATLATPWLVDSNYGSNYTYELGTAGAGKVYWITIACRYNTRQVSYLRDNGTDIWHISHEQLQGKSYHCVFDPPIPFTTQLQINICASGLASIGYVMDA